MLNLYSHNRLRSSVYGRAMIDINPMELMRFSNRFFAEEVLQMHFCSLTRIKKELFWRFFKYLFTKWHPTSFHMEISSSSSTRGQSRFDWRRKICNCWILEGISLPNWWNFHSARWYIYIYLQIDWLEQGNPDWKSPV